MVSGAVVFGVSVLLFFIAIFAIDDFKKVNEEIPLSEEKNLKLQMMPYIKAKGLGKIGCLTIAIQYKKWRNIYKMT